MLVFNNPSQNVLLGRSCPSAAILQHRQLFYVNKTRILLDQPGENQDFAFDDIKKNMYRIIRHILENVQLETSRRCLLIPPECLNKCNFNI